MSTRTATRPRVAPARKPAGRARPPARTKTPGIGAQLRKAFAALPIPDGLLRRLRNWLLALLLIAAIGAGLVAMGVPQMIGLSLAHAAGRAGLVVRNVQIEGRDHVDRNAIYAAVIDAKGQDMPLVDLTGLRRSLLGIPWVAEARVSRRLPDTLVVDIVERRPAAIWQYQQRLALVDDSGNIIAPLDPQSAPEQFPIVIGRGANLQVDALTKLIATQPVLKPLIQDATWVGERRWDLHFQSGEILSLPEGEEPARTALASFARKDSEKRLLGKGIVRFDMRDPTRIVVRVTDQPGFRLDKLEAPAPAPVAPPASVAPAPAPEEQSAPAPQPISQEKVL